MAAAALAARGARPCRLPRPFGWCCVHATCVRGTWQRHARRESAGRRAHTLPAAAGPAPRSRRNVYGFPQDRASGDKIALLPAPNNSIAWNVFVQGIFYQARRPPRAALPCPGPGPWPWPIAIRAGAPALAFKTRPAGQRAAGQAAAFLLCAACSQWTSATFPLTPGTC